MPGITTYNQEHNMSTEHSEDQYYQGLIRRNGRKILILSFALLTLGALFELKTYIQAKEQNIAQTQFESYLETPDSKIALHLQKEHPLAIQTQLVTLLEAKKLFVQNELVDAEKYLAFVINHSQDDGVKTIATYRLSMLYRQLGQIDKAQSTIDMIPSHTAYSKLMAALTLPEHSDARMYALDEAIALSPSPYIAQLITIAQHNNIETV
jgi:predicted negative regulator of RcsB-dependent stress response